MQHLDLDLQIQVAARNRTHRVFIGILKLSFLLGLGYSLLYIFAGAPGLALLTSGITVLFAVLFYLEKKRIEIPARVLFVTSCAIVIVISDLQFNGSAASRLFFLPTICLTYFLFRTYGRRLKILVTVLPLFAWIGLEIYQHSSIGTYGVMPKAFQPLTISIVRGMTILGSCIFTFTIFYMVQRETKNYEEQLQKLFADLRRAQNLLIYQAKMAAVGEMAGEIAHEINNPLEIIRSRLLTKKSGELDESDQKIMAMTERIAAIIKGLRSSVRNSGQDNMVLYSVKEIINDAVELAKLRYQKFDVKLDYPLLNPKIQVLCLPVEIVQVMISLLNNALDAVKDQSEKWVRIGVQEDNESLEIHIVDNGPGVAKDLREEIFKAFFTTKPPESGTGLGLSIARNIMDKHNGKLILAEHSPTTFIVRLKRNPMV
jgi:signal transduction histidine kinase